MRATCALPLTQAIARGLFLPLLVRYPEQRASADDCSECPVGTHRIRHRSATDIANSGIPVKVGMALTAYKTVTMFMRHVHTEDDPVRAAAALVANRRKAVVESHPIAPNDIPEPIADSCGTTPA